MDLAGLGEVAMKRKHQKIPLGIPTVLPGLPYDGTGKVQCALCHRWFRDLEPHIRQTHSLSADDYREEYGLNRTQPLCPPEKSAKLAAILIARGWAGQGPGRLLCGGQRGMKMRIQGRMAVSLASTGSKKTLTPRKLAAQRANANKREKRVCVRCGRESSLRPSQKYCPACATAAKAESDRNWRQANREHLREYMRQWYARHPKGAAVRSGGEEARLS